MGGRTTLLAAALLLSASSPAGSAAPGERPLPVDATRKLQDEGAVYTVEGRVRVPKGVELSVFKGITIRAAGSAPAVIQVDGGFDAVGVQGREVVFENVTVEPGESFESIRLVTTLFRNGGGLRTSEGKPADGKTFVVELSDFMKPCAVDLAFAGGSLSMLSSCFDLPVRVRGATSEPGKRSRLRAAFRQCGQDETYRCRGHMAIQGFRAGLTVEDAEEVTIQACRLGGENFSVKGWSTRLLFTANKVEAPRAEFVAREPGLMAKVQCQENDFLSGDVWVSAPPKAGLRDSLRMDRCWFRGLTDPGEILRKVVRDGEDVPEVNGARVVLVKVAGRPSGMGGKVE
jgi:hypothetical protein